MSETILKFGKDDDLLNFIEKKIIYVYFRVITV
jgi:hypothetical protein